MASVTFSKVLWRAGLTLLALSFAGGCPAVDTALSDSYTIRWSFVNNSTADVTFDYGIGDEDEGLALVPRGTTAVRTSSGLVQGTTVEASVSILGNPALESVQVPVVPDGTSSVTATWDGSRLTISAACPSPAKSSAGGPAGVTTPFEPAAATCQAPVKWTLEGISGSASANWQDQAASASGTLTFSVPQEIEPGQTYTVSATFSGSITVNAGWGGYSSNVTVGMIDRVTFGLPNVNNSANTGALPVGTATRAVTVNGSWVIPSNPTALALEASGGWTMAGPGNANPPKLVATYKKVP